MATRILGKQSIAKSACQRSKELWSRVIACSDSVGGFTKRRSMEGRLSSSRLLQPPLGRRYFHKGSVSCLPHDLGMKNTTTAGGAAIMPPHHHPAAEDDVVSLRNRHAYDEDYDAIHLYARPSPVTTSDLGAIDVVHMEYDEGTVYLSGVGDSLSIGSYYYEDEGELPVVLAEDDLDYVDEMDIAAGMEH